MQGRKLRRIFEDHKLHCFLYVLFVCDVCVLCILEDENVKNKSIYSWEAMGTVGESKKATPILSYHDIIGKID